MALHADLLEQARHLARKEPTRPKQASLKRSVSAAYYALFHFLVDRGTRFLVSGASAERDVLRRAVGRAFQHGQMRNVSWAFAGRGRNPWMALFPAVVPPDLATVAASFVELQQARHAADYDSRRPFSRQEVMDLIDRADEAISLWPGIAENPQAKAYLLGLLLNTRQ